jgi:hypothetical protein
MQITIYKSRICVVLMKAAAVRILSSNESFHGIQRHARAVWELNGIGTNKRNPLRWICLIELFSPMRSFILQDNVVPDRLLCFFTSVYLSILMVALIL